MVIEPESTTRLAFGPFEVNFATGELRRGGVRIRLSGQPLQILRILLAHPGEVVTRDQLREQIWKDGTFVDFEHGLNAAINKLRRTLGDSAENPRYIETVPGRGYRFIGVLAQDSPASPVSAEAAVPAATVGQEKASPRGRTRFWWWLAAGVTCALSFVLGWYLHKSATPKGEWKRTRLTADPGLSDHPAISRDGALVAYSSDRSAEGQRDLYVMQVAGEQPIRLTSDGAGNTTPDFSPDGSRIVYHSDREGGGIYVIPTFGGEPRLLARGGLSPRFSPDGSKIAYWIGGINVVTVVPGSSSVWVISASGGEPRQVATDLTSARYPVWSPDGRNLLLLGYSSQKAFDRQGIDWWMASVDAGPTVRTGAYDALIRAGAQTSLLGLPDIPEANCWLQSNEIIFSNLTTDARNLWEGEVSRRTGKVNGEFNRLTDGTANEVEPSCAGANILAITDDQMRRNIWSVPIDLNSGVVQGEIKHITETPERQEHASLSADGRFVAFAATQAGRMNIWLREIATGRETHLDGSPLIQRFPISNASGSRVAFSVYEQNGIRSVYVSNASGGADKVCEGCLRATDWSRDENSLLVFSGTPYEIGVIDLGSRKRTTILKRANYNLIYARYSPDNRWVSFTERYQPDRARIMIAPVDGTKPVPESAWIEIAEVGPEDWANWSPDGKTLYFTSAKDGHFCFWGQRLDSVSHRPVGETFGVLHLHGHVSYQQGGWSAAGGRLAMVATEDTGNIWIMTREKTH